VVDYVIAATAESLHLPLWTRNVRHFPMLKGLKAPY
jgi:predicted nucleic acid-binding protein